MLLKSIRHGIFYVVGLIEIFGDPIVDFVELEKDAWTTLLVSEFLVLNTWREGIQIYLTGFTLSRLVVLTIDTCSIILRVESYEYLICVLVFGSYKDFNEITFQELF